MNIWKFFNNSKMNEATPYNNAWQNDCVKNVFHYFSQNWGGNEMLFQGLISLLEKNDNIISINEIVSEKI